MAELILDNLSKRYGDDTVVDQLSLTIPQGEFVALLGPSGCGKSTTLRMLAGFESLTGGSISLNGRVLASDNTHLEPEQRNMGMVFQSYALWPHMSVAQNVGYALRMRGIKGEARARKVREALEVVRLERYAESSPRDLSGGQRQRVALARCLVSEPEVVLLDEPLANLDRHLRASMEDSFREFHRRTGATLVYVTHDQSEAMSLADRVAVMQSGRLVQWATPQQLYARPRTPWLAGFIGEGSVIDLPSARPGEAVSGAALAQGLARSHGLLASAAGPVLVRPEHVRIRNAADGDGGVAARVVDTAYRGERFSVRLRLAGQQELLAYHSHPLALDQAVQLDLEHGWALEQTA
ncbi:ABC transporter ATP-binding protein [Marinobacterium rhizophilum]|uniref:ABC transporter ATP-binding protein n=1 Tax=Marinobacterium rhizophilum TaxID=420402 RepID=A0ABY5HK49_9GAMM|nr:ABC transporter ATP-binding protein [Marinobacterium rhizophilum]UTW11642.1 ABC transporter ATP-binding protein [Marinobacterium rhizophilum]